MAFTVEDRDAVREAMVRMAVEGVVSVSVDGTTVTARSMADLERLLALIDRDLAVVGKGSPIRFAKLVPPSGGGSP